MFCGEFSSNLDRLSDNWLFLFYIFLISCLNLSFVLFLFLDWDSLQHFLFIIIGVLRFDIWYDLTQHFFNYGMFFHIYIFSIYYHLLKQDLFFFWCFKLYFYLRLIRRSEFFEERFLQILNLFVVSLHCDIRLVMGHQFQILHLRLQWFCLILLCLVLEIQLHFFFQIFARRQ